MTRHQLQGRTEEEVLWFQRRSALKAGAAWVAMGGFSAAMAQQSGNVVELAGDALVNGARLLTGQTIQTGDRIQTGPGSRLVFVLGNASFLVRQNTMMTVERGRSLNAVSVLRILTGAVASVWNKGADRTIVTPTITAGIRGTGVYTEVMPPGDGRSYFCNCYGTVELAAGSSRTLSQAEHHQSFWSVPVAANPHLTPGQQSAFTLAPAQFLNHTDEELEFLAGLIGQRTAWQITGIKTSTGY
ncbi:MAG: iron dicitrate transport regulator FecR [Comamonadaceae bacterium]|nr:MAG: iron dicitrate transport regulator FecR [Comamonadaceae bacterium]